MEWTKLGDSVPPPDYYWLALESGTVFKSYISASHTLEGMRQSGIQWYMPYRFPAHPEQPQQEGE